MYTYLSCDKTTTYSKANIANDSMTYLSGDSGDKDVMPSVVVEALSAVARHGVQPAATEIHAEKELTQE